MNKEIPNHYFQKEIDEDNLLEDMQKEYYNSSLELRKKKIKDYTLALLYLNAYLRGSKQRAWKDFDWATLSKLHDDNMIRTPVGRQRSVVFTERGYKKAKNLFFRFFINDEKKEK